MRFLASRPPSFIFRSGLARMTTVATPTSTPPPPPQAKRPVTVDRPLPEVNPGRGKKIAAFGIAVVIWTIGAALAFNHERMLSPIVPSTLHSLRRSAGAQKLIGDKIDYYDTWPWISGKINQGQGIVDIEYDVKGSKQGGRMHFKSIRRTKNGQWELNVWTLRADSGEILNLAYELENPQDSLQRDKEAMSILEG
ncbi:cytochrome oxidase assembly protein 1 [Saitoella coloradoensis]